MARTPAQRGRIGNWLVERRLARGWETQANARAEIERLAGWRIPQSVYAEWESGRRVPSDENYARLVEFYGAQPSEATPDASIVSAIDRLTAQVARIETRLEANSGAFDGLADALLALLVQVTGTASENGAASELPLSERR